MEGLELWLRVATGSCTVDLCMSDVNFITVLGFFLISGDDEKAIFFSYLGAPKAEIITNYAQTGLLFDKNPAEYLKILIQEFGAVISHSQVSYKAKINFVEALIQKLLKSKLISEDDQTKDQNLIFTNPESLEDAVKVYLWANILLGYLNTKNPLPNFETYLSALCGNEFDSWLNNAKQDLKSIPAIFNIFLLNDDRTDQPKDQTLLERVRKDSLDTLVCQYQEAFFAFEQNWAVLDQDAFRELLRCLAILITHPKVTFEEKLMYLKDVVDTLALIPNAREYQGEVDNMKNAINYFLEDNYENRAISVFGACVTVFYEERNNSYFSTTEYCRLVLEMLLFLLPKLAKRDASFHPIQQFEAEMPIDVQEENINLTPPIEFVLFCASGFHTGNCIRGHTIMEKSPTTLAELLLEFKELAQKMTGNFDNLIDWMYLADLTVQILVRTTCSTIISYLEMVLYFFMTHFENIYKSLHKKEYEAIKTFFDGLSKLIDSCTFMQPLRIISLCSFAVRTHVTRMQECLMHHKLYWEALLMQLMLLLIAVKVCQKCHFLGQNKPEPDYNFKFNHENAKIIIGMFNCFLPTALRSCAHLCKSLRGCKKVIDLNSEMGALARELKENLETKESAQKTADFALSVSEYLASSTDATKMENDLMQILEEVKKLLEKLLESEEKKWDVMTTLSFVMRTAETLQSNDDYLNIYVAFIEGCYASYNMSGIEINLTFAILYQLETLVLMFIVLHKLTKKGKNLPQKFLALLQQLEQLINAVATF